MSAAAILGSSRQAGAAAAGRSRGAAAAAAGGRVNLADVRLQLQQKLKQQSRRVAELESSLTEVQQQLEAAQGSRNVMADALEQARGLFKRQMEAAAREVAHLTQRTALAAGEPGHLLAVGPDELLVKLVSYIDNLLQAAASSVSEARRETEAVASRHSSLKRQLRLLYTGYRSLRYKLEDEWPAGGAAPRVPHEDAVMGGSVDALVRADDESARQELLRQQNKVSTLEAALAAAKVRQLEFDTLGPAGVGNLSSSLTSQQSSLTGAAAAALQLENSRLRQELDALKRRLPALGLLTRTNSSSTNGAGGGSGAAGGVSEQLTAEVAQLRGENQRLRAVATAAAGTGSAGASGGAAAAAAAATAAAAEAAGGLRRQLKEFTLNTQLELERHLKAAESRTVMAEEQLSHLQRYLATASVAYQREIVRLRAALQQADPAALRALGSAAVAAAATAAGPNG